MPIAKQINKLFGKNERWRATSQRLWCSLKSRGNKRLVIGTNNQITYREATMVSSSISVKGSRNKIHIEEGAYLKDVKIEVIGDDNTINIGHQTFVVAGSTMRIFSTHCSLVIGSNVHVGKADFHLGEPSTHIIVGNRCMIAEEVLLACTDWHAIVDKQSNKRINMAGNIELEDDVWLAYRVQILKGVHIGKGSVIGTGSIVTKSVPANALAVGIPAKVIKTGITWDVDLVPNEHTNN